MMAVATLMYNFLFEFKAVSNSVFHFRSLSLSQFAALLIVLVSDVICKSYQTTIKQNQERTRVFSDCVMKSYNFVI